MTTTLEKYPIEVADAIRDMADVSIDREVPAIRLIDHILRQFEPDAAERILTWAWDRYVVHNPRRVAVAEHVTEEGAR